MISSYLAESLRLGICRLIRGWEKRCLQRTWTLPGQVTRKKFNQFNREKWPLSLRCSRITMVQAAESRQGVNLASSPRSDRRRPARWRVLLESKMSPVLVVVE
jgi:hypothetical protein